MTDTTRTAHAHHATLTMNLSGSAADLADVQRFVFEFIADGRLRGSAEIHTDYSTIGLDELLSFGTDSEAERPRTLLRRGGIRTVADLEGKTADDLLSITNFGQKSLDFLNACLRQQGFPEVSSKPYGR
jgi:hypothetical protein